MHSVRRTFLRGALSSASLSVAAAVGLLRPASSWAWTFPPLFQFNPATPGGFVSPVAPVVPLRPAQSGPAADMLQALKAAQVTESADIHVLVPTIAENGASVFLECHSTLPEVDGMALFVEHNPQPLAAGFWFAPEVLPELRTRLKLSQTSNVTVVARSRGQFYKATKNVVVTVGGCGVGLN